MLTAGCKGLQYCENKVSAVIFVVVVVVHPLLDMRTAKGMNKFFYNMATISWALKHVLFVSHYNVLNMRGEGKQTQIGS